jgi:hypothetical protein
MDRVISFLSTHGDELPPSANPLPLWQSVIGSQRAFPHFVATVHGSRPPTERTAPITASCQRRDRDGGRRSPIGGSAAANAASSSDRDGAYPQAIRTALGKTVTHRTNAHLNNRLEQDHRGIKGRIRCMRGFASFVSAGRSCRDHDELRNFLRVRAFRRQSQF